MFRYNVLCPEKLYLNSYNFKKDLNKGKYLLCLDISDPISYLNGHKAFFPRLFHL